MRRRDDFQVHRKSRLPGQMSRRVEKPTACGRFGLMLVSYTPLALSAALALLRRTGPREQTQESGVHLTRIGTFEH